MADATRDRSAFTKGLDAKAWAVRIGSNWFAGFGKDTSIVKLRSHLADARLMVSRQQAADYIRRLAERGHLGGQIFEIQVAGSAT